jgi:hypothetical protein
MRRIRYVYVAYVALVRLLRIRSVYVAYVALRIRYVYVTYVASGSAGRRAAQVKPVKQDSPPP